MKYTIEQLEGMSDGDINQEITVEANNLHGWELSQSGFCFYHCGADGNDWVDFQIADYCNNPSAMMPLVFEAGIELSPLPITGNWSATFIMDRDIFSIHENPLRASAVVWLLMGGE